MNMLTVFFGDLGMNWIQLRDASREAVKKYVIGPIPHTVLIDPSGKIIAKDLRGQELENLPHVDLLRGHPSIRGDADCIAEDSGYSSADAGDQIAESGFSGLTDRSCLAPSGCHGGSDYYLRRNCGEILQVGIKQ